MKVKDLIEALKGEPPESEIKIEAFFDPRVFLNLRASISLDGALSDEPVPLDLVMDWDDD